MENNLITTALAKFSLSDAAIAELNKQYSHLTIAGLDDKEGYRQVREARLLVKGKRVEIEKTRKELKEESLAYGRAVDSEAKRLTAALLPIENHLAAEEKAIDDEKERIRVEKERERERERAALLQARIDQLTPLGAKIDLATLSTMTDEEFSVTLEAASVVYEQEQVRLAELAHQQEIERLEREKRAREEAERQAAIAAEQERQRQAIAEESRQAEELARAAREDAEKQAAIARQQEAERQKLAEERRKLAEEERRRREELKEAELRLAEKEAAIRAEQEVQATQPECPEELQPGYPFDENAILSEQEEDSMEASASEIAERCRHYINDWDGLDAVDHLRTLSKDILAFIKQLGLIEH